jgi:hypothetical protein
MRLQLVFLNFEGSLAYDFSSFTLLRPDTFTEGWVTPGFSVFSLPVGAFYIHLL